MKKYFFIVVSLLILLCSTTVYAANYYSQSTDVFSNVSNWNTIQGGGGSSPVFADLLSGLHVFIVQDGHAVTVDTTIDVAALAVGGGSSGVLTLGDNTTARSVTVQGALTISSGATFDVGAFIATHTVIVQGAITNNGILDLKNTSSKVANITVDGTFSITGNAPQFNSITFNSGTVTAGVAFDIEGDVTIEDGAAFADGGYTHTVGGNWTENGSGARSGSGTIEMDGSIVQTITATASFNNLTFNGGGIVTISGGYSDYILTVNGDLHITNNTFVTTASRHTMKGNFMVDAGSTYNATNGRLIFDNASVSQTLTLNGSVTFDEVYFNNGSPTYTKTIIGDYTANDQTYIYNDADVTASAGNHTFEALRVDGTCQMNDTMNFTGGYVYNNSGDAVSLSAAAIFMSGTVTLYGSDSLKVPGNVTVNSGSLRVNGGSWLIGNSGKTFTLVNGANVRMRGADNFPSGFSTYTLGATSVAEYDLSGPQTVRGGITYGELEVDGSGSTKTVDGALDINGYLDLNGGATLDLQSYDHTFSGATLYNGTNSSISAAGGTFAFDLADANQTIATCGSGSYVFNNLTFTNSAPTAVRTKNIDGNITVNGAFSATNAEGSEANYMILDIDANTISNDGGDDFALGANVQLRTSGASNFGTSMSSFGSVTLNVESAIRFDGTNQDLSGGITYGNLYLRGDGNKTALSALDINGDIWDVDWSVPVFIDGGFSHTVAGDWIMTEANTSMTGTITFDGATQSISESNFYNVVFGGSGTKTLTDELFVDGNLTVNDGVTVDGNTRDIYIAGNWVVNGAGVFTQTTGETQFNGTTANQTISMNASSYFGDLQINKTNASFETVTASTDITIYRDFTFNSGDAIFDLNGKTLNIGDDWIFNTGTTFTHNNGTVNFSGSIDDQHIYNYNSSIVFYHLGFSGTGSKTFESNSVNIDGNVTITNSTVNAWGYALTVAGNWTNTGSFQHTGRVTFDGGNQTIGGSAFHDVYIDGTNTKTLGGNITLSGVLLIEDGGTLDVSENNYSVSVEEAWNNGGTGIFTPQNGTVTFIGAGATFTTGGSGAGKTFYNLIVNVDETARITLSGELKVENDFILTSGYFRTNANSMYIAGSLVNTSSRFDHNNSSSVITFNGSGGTHSFDPGDDVFRNIVFDASGATYQLAGELTFYSNRDLTINNGTLDLNANTVNMVGSSSVVTINGGTLEVDSAATLKISDGSSITNAGGTLKVLGVSASPANIAIRTTGDYAFTQTSGTIHAQYYNINNTNGNGVDIQGGAIDNTNNFCNGNFSGGVGIAYLTLTGYDFGGGATVANVSFGSGPTYNVTRASGTGAITFENASGTFAGEAYDNDDADPGTKILWTFPDGIFWDGEAGTNDWNDQNNWTGNTVPGANDKVYLEHSIGGVSAAYAVEIKSLDALASILSMDAEGGNTISLTLNGYDLTVGGSVTIGASTTLAQTNATDTIKVAGNWSNAGIFNENTAVVFFNGSGTNTITTGGASDPFYNIVFDAEGATYNLGDNLDVNNNFTISSGTFEIPSGGHAVTIGGDFSVSNGVFSDLSGSVTFDGTTQLIDGGTFYDFIIDGSGTKTLSGNISIGDDLTIASGTVLAAATHNIYVADDWINNSGTSAFTHSGNSTVYFNGANQNIDDGSSATTFNTVYLQGSGTKDINKSITVNGDLNIVSGINRIDVNTAIIITGSGGSNTLSMTGGTMRVLGVNNFPTGFETITISGGTVDYYSNSNQTIAAATYNDLTIRRVDSGTPTKTLAGNITVNDDLDFDDGNSILDVAGYTVSVYDAFTFASGNAITWNNGSFIHIGGSETLDADITEYHNITLGGISESTKTIAANLTVTGDLIVESNIYFDMNAYTITGTGSGKTLTLEETSRLFCAVPTATGVAFPTGFDTYILNQSSDVFLDGSASQTVYSTPNYGILDINTNGNATLDGHLDVNGDFDMNDASTLVDGGYNINIAGATADLRDYTPSSTITLDGTDQSIYDGGSSTVLLNNVVFAGSGTKTLTETTTDINGTLTINNGVIVSSTAIIVFGGSTWTNNGTFSHTNYTTTFDGLAKQTINPGSDNGFYDVVFSNTSDTVHFIGNGLDVNDDFTINASAIVDMGSVTHTIQDEIRNNGTWICTNANLTFDGAGQTIPAFTAQDIICAGSGSKYLAGNWSVDDITIYTGVTLDVTSSDYSITVTGNWTNNGFFYDQAGTVVFESNNTDSKTITTKNDDLYNVSFNQSQTNTRTYILQDNSIFSNNLTVGAGATLDLNGKTLSLGNADVVESHTIETGGTIEVDANAILQIDCDDGDIPFTVAGTLKAVGTDGNEAKITRFNGSYRINLDITTGTIKAQYYIFEYLDDNGLDIQSGATIDPTNNLSNGSFSQLSSGGGRYMNIDADVSAIGNVSDVTFNYSGSPSVSTHYNVKRDAAATGTLTFDGSINGSLAGTNYEDDAGGKINWPVASSVTWDGSESTDWNNANNWTPATLPTSSIDVTIPIESNNPIIGSAQANCKSLTITDGQLSLDGGYDLVVAGDIIIGTGTNAAVLAVGNAACEIEIGGGWTRGSNALFANGDGTVTFNASSGSVTINPDNSTFNNVVFDSSATFNMVGSTITVDSNITINYGTVALSNSSYTLYVGGDIINVSGDFSTSTSGTIVLTGASQDIAAMSFYNLTVSGSGTKTTSGATTIRNILTINSTLTAGTGSSIDINGNMIIAEGGTFNDGGESHTFAGGSWTGSGTYSGSGTVTFDRFGNQNVYASTFSNVLFYNDGDIDVLGNIEVTGNLTINTIVDVFDCDTYQINCSSGSGTFHMDDTIYFYIKGANNFPSGFSTYSIGPNSSAFYNGTIDQTVKGITYGNLTLLNATTKTLGGSVDINGRLEIGDGVTMDVSTNNYTVNLAGTFDMNTSGQFICQSGELVFDGVSGTQELLVRPSASKVFNKITVNKASGSVRVRYNDITINSNLMVLSGYFDVNNETVTVGGDLLATGGTYTTSGKYILNKTSGSANISMNGSTLNNFTINSGATYTLQDDLIVNGNTTLTAGTFDGNGNTVTLGDGTDVVSISGTYKIGTGGTLKLGSNAALTVNSGGSIYIVGTADNVATITRRTTGRYSFTVDGIIHAQYYLIEHMATTGILVSSSGTINPTNNFSNGTFTSCASGGTCFRVENTQNFVDPEHIDNVSFPSNPGSGAYNITKSSSVSGDIEMYAAQGAFSGSDYENDPNNLIDWTGSVILTWTGSSSTDWNTIGNWSADVGSDKIPTISDDVVIASAVNQPILTSGGAVAKSITINSGASLSLSTAAETETDLSVSGDITITGSLVMNSANDTIQIAGNWTRTGSYTPGGGMVIFNPSSGTKTISNGAAAFYDVSINTSGTVQLGANTTVSNDLTIISGTLDASTSNRTLTIGGSFVNDGAFTARSGKLVLNASTAGTEIFNPGSSSYYDIDVDAGGSTTYQLTTNNLSVTSDVRINTGTFDLNSLIFNMGDGSGVDVLTIAATLEIDANADLKMGASSAILLNSGAVFKAVGTSGNVATLSRQSSGTYSMTVNSGAIIHAKYYLIEYTDATGIWVKSGASIDATNDFAEGTFSNGAAGGRYLLLENNFSDITAENVVFNAGPDKNVKRISGTGNIIFQDAAGTKAGYLHEDDNGSASSGRVQWTSTSAETTWDGSESTEWETADNWSNGVPTVSKNTIIPNVTNDPVISTANASTKKLTIYSGGQLTINTNKSLTIIGSMTNSGIITVSDGSSSIIYVDEAWSNSGTFNSGNSSTVEFTDTNGIKSITSGGDAFYNLHINSSGAGTATFQTLDSIEVNGNFTISAGTFQVTNANHKLKIAGNWSNSGTFTHGSSTVKFDGSGAQGITNVSGETFYNLTINGSGTITLNNNITVYNDILISSTLNANSKTITLKGDWTNSGIFTYATSTVNLTGTAAQTITNSSGENFYNLIVNNSYGSIPQLILSAATTITSGGTLTLTDGVVESSASYLMIIADGGLLSGGNSASYVNGPMKRIGSSDFTFHIGAGSVYARLGISGMLSTGTFTAQYYNEAYSDIASHGSGVHHVSNYEYWNLARNAGSAEPYVTYYWESGANSEIDNLDSLLTANYESSQWESKGGSTSGSVSSGSIISTSKYTSFGIGGFASKSLNENPLHATYTTWTGEISTDWANIDNWTNGIPNDAVNVTVSSIPSNQPVISAAANCNDITINAGASLTINAGYTLTAGRDVLIKSSETEMASLLLVDNTAVLSVAGTSTVQCYLSATSWHYVSIPITSSTALPLAGYSVKKYTESAGNWTNLINSDPLEVMHAYTTKWMVSGSSHTASFEGTLNAGNKSVSVDSTATGQGWELVGNPYPSAIDWNAGSGWTKTNINNTIYYYNGTQYATWNGSVGTNGGTRYIPAMQGFFIQAKGSGSLAVDNRVRVINDQEFWKKKSEENEYVNLLKLQIEGNGYSDQAVIHFRDDAKDGFDGDFDAHKMFNENLLVPQIYTFSSNGKELAINTMPSKGTSFSIPLSSKIQTSGNYKISSKETSSFNDDVRIYLEDKQNGKIIDLKSYDYEFNSSSSDINNRFILHFSGVESTISETEKDSENNINIYHSGGSVYVNSNISGTVVIYNAIGQEIKRIEVVEENKVYKISINQDVGIYYVKMVTESGVITKTILKK